ncbi:MAG: hypothetical protein IPH75_11490 [bacterium]|nr:hypothetical protein [bacterium]
MLRTRLTLSVIALFLLVVAQVATADVPRSLSYQGRLTDAGGVPLSGVYNIEFKISDAAVLGALLYASGPQPVTVTNGLFSVNIGAPPMPALPLNIFADTSRYLGITVGADPEQTPRTKLTSVAYAYQVRTVDGATGGEVSGTINTTSGGNPRASLMPGTSQISTYGSDNLEQARIWGGTWGEVLLFDSDGSNDQTARLGSQSGLVSDGGLLELNNDDGSPNIILHAGSTGDAAVVVPNSSISALEIGDEPGIASNTGAAANVTGGAANVALRTIIAPTPGYVVVMASGSFDCTHITGSFSQRSVWVTEVNGGSSAGKPKQSIVISTNAPSGNYGTPFCVQGTFAVPAGVSTFYLRGDHVAGGGITIIDDAVLTLMFFPTAYGTVTAFSPESNDNGPEIFKSGAGEDLTGEEFASKRLEYEVAQLKKQLAEIRAKMGNTSQADVQVKD